MHERMDALLQSAELLIEDFDIHIRNEMQTYNRILPNYVMSYVKKGEAKLRVRSEVYNLTPGTAVIIPPNVQHDHYMANKEETTFLWCHFTYKIGNAIDVMKIINFPITFKLQNSEIFERVFIEFKNLTSSENFLIKTILKRAKSYELLYLLMNNIMSAQEEVYEQEHSKGFICMLNQIVKNPESELSLKELSKSFICILHISATDLRSYLGNRRSRSRGN